MCDFQGASVRGWTANVCVILGGIKKLLTDLLEGSVTIAYTASVDVQVNTRHHCGNNPMIHCCTFLLALHTCI